MAKWKYVGPVYAKGVLLADGSLIFPEQLIDDAQVEAILTKYPGLSPYWRNTDDTGGGVDITANGIIDFTPLSNAMQAATTDIQNLYNSLL